MNQAVLKPQTQDIVVDEVLPHAPETIWQALTDGVLMKRWMMEPTGFAPVVGNRFTYKTKPAGAWDGTIHCEVLEVIPHQRFRYAWRGGDDANTGYGSKLDTVVTWTLSKAANGTRLRLVHAGFVTPKNDTAFQNMSSGWKTVLAKLDQAIGEN